MHKFDEEDLRLFAKAWVEKYVKAENMELDHVGYWEEMMFQQLMEVFEQRFKEQAGASV